MARSGFATPAGRAREGRLCALPSRALQPGVLLFPATGMDPRVEALAPAADPSPRPPQTHRYLSGLQGGAGTRREHDFGPVVEVLQESGPLLGP